MWNRRRMPHAEIRHVQLEDIGPWIKCMRTTFFADPASGLSEADRAWWQKLWQSDRSWGAYDSGRCVATLRTFPTTVTVPFAAEDCPEIPADALTQVTVAGTHRRQGLLTSMLTRSLDEAKQRGELVSLLRAAEWPIYGRFGYWPATTSSNYQISTHRRLQVTSPLTAVEVSQVEPADLVEPASTVLSRVRRQRAGHIDRVPEFWSRRLGLDGLTPAVGSEPACVVARDATGAVDGYAVWTAKGGDWLDEPAEVIVHELLAATDDAYRALWGYLVNLDLVKALFWNEQAVDEPLEWLLSDGRAAKRGPTTDNMWLRLLDVPAALSARRYAAADTLVIDVVDDDATGYGQGRVTLETGPGAAECRRTPKATADLRLSQRALAALYLSGQSAWSQAQAGLIDEETPGALARLEALFCSAKAPWNSTPF
jgi:predicted acetyltransferase